MKFMFYNFIFHLIYFFLNLLNPIIKIRFLQIETRAIGHMSQAIEIHLNEKKQKIIDECLFDIYFPQKEIANLYLWKKWKKILKIKIPDKISRFVFQPIYFIALKKNNKNMLIPFRNNSGISFNKNLDTQWQSQDKYNVLDNTNPLINFSLKEKQRGLNFLKEIDISINDKIVLLISRDPKYRNNLKNLPYHEYSYRDTDINVFEHAVEYLCSLNYKVIRMGRDMDKKLNIKNPNFFDYAFSEKKSDFLDIFLFEVCNFVISTGTGLDNVSSLFRKKILHVNYADLMMMRYFNSNVALVYPKKFIDIDTNKELNIYEIYEKLPKNFDSRKNDLLEKYNINYKSLSREEIKYACIEMIDFLKKGTDSKTLEMNKKIKNNFKNKYNVSFKSNFCKNYLINFKKN